MAYSAHEFYLPGITAGADLSAKQCYLAKLTAAQVVGVCSSAGDRVAGVICNKPTSGQSVLLQTDGVAKVIAGGTIAAGDPVGTDGNGKAVTKSADGDLTFGFAVQAAVAGDLFSVQLALNGQRGA